MYIGDFSLSFKRVLGIENPPHYSCEGLVQTRLIPSGFGRFIAVQENAIRVESKSTTVGPELYKCCVITSMNNGRLSQNHLVNFRNCNQF